MHRVQSSIRRRRCGCHTGTPQYIARRAGNDVVSSEHQGDANRPPPNIRFFTLGGRQFWADVFVYAGWRVQENALTGHHRLLDPKDVRHCIGTLEQCRTAFDEQRRALGIAPRGRHLVLLIHGLGRSRDSLAVLENTLRDAGFEAMAISYPSTRRSLTEHGDRLEQLLDGLIDVDTVSFVTHSLGGLLVREVLGRDSAWRGRIALGRAVMLAPPNQGAAIADAMQGFTPYHLLFGDSGRAVTREAAAMLPPLPLPFGIIAGGRGDDAGNNPLLEGDDDGVVKVAETRLPGAADFLLVDVLHSFIMDHAETVFAVRRFLETGRFAGEFPGDPPPD